MTAPLRTSYFPVDTSDAVLELTAGDLLRARARDAGDTLALIEVAPPGSASLSGAARVDRRWTYTELAAEAEHCARWLLDRFTPGDRITVWAPNIPEWVILQYGAALAGLVLVTANPALRSTELRYVLEQSRSVGLFHTDAFRGTDMTVTAGQAAVGLPIELCCFADWNSGVRGNATRTTSLPHVAPGDAAQIQYTSGTTGVPKGALLHHRGLITNARFYTRRAGFPAGGTLVGAMPLFHTAGSAMSVLGCAVTSSTYALVQQFDPALVLTTLADLGGDAFIGVPTMMIAMLAHPLLDELDLSRCSVVVSGGSSVPPQLVRRVEDTLGVQFTTVYGQTELSPVIAQTRLDDSDGDKAGTVGRPLPQVEVSVVDPLTGKPVPVGEQGESCARGYQQMIGYFEMPEATAATVDAQGWLHTGDLGTMDERGYLRITGRLKDMIIRGGENIYPREVEELLFGHPGVQDVAVVGVPDERWGEHLAALVQLHDPAQRPTPQDLIAYCRKHLAPHKTPQEWFVTEQLPLTGSGKVQKFRIVSLLAAGRYPKL